MRHTPRYVVTDPAVVKDLIRSHPWATFVSHTANGLVASHYPVILDEGAQGIVLISHFGKPDDASHELGEHEVLVIFQGPHGYVSSSWYDEGDNVPTWNHVTAHVYGIPEVLSEEENYRMLERLTDHFESAHPGGRSLDVDEAAHRTMAKGTVGLRLIVTRFDARAKLSQNKPAHVRETITAHYESSNPALAQRMRDV